VQMLGALSRWERGGAGSELIHAASFPHLRGKGTNNLPQKTPVGREHWLKNDVAKQ